MSWFRKSRVQIVSKWNRVASNLMILALHHETLTTFSSTECSRNCSFQFSGPMVIK